MTNTMTIIKNNGRPRTVEVFKDDAQDTARRVMRKNSKARARLKNDQTHPETNNWVNLPTTEAAACITRLYLDALISDEPSVKTDTRVAMAASQLITLSQYAPGEHGTPANADTHTAFRLLDSVIPQNIILGSE